MGPTIRQWRLAAELSRLRERAELSQEEVVAATGISRKTLSRFENGAGVPKLRDLRTLLDLYGATEEERCDLEQTARQAKERGWWASEPYSGAVSPGLGLYFSLEDASKSIRRWLSTGIHGLLQTPDYARAVECGLKTTPMTLLDVRVQIRLERQRRAFAPGRGLHLHCVMDEAILHRMVGGPTVMAFQLRHLIAMANDPKLNLTLQILPFAAGLVSGPAVDFTIFEIDGDHLFAADDGTFGPEHYDRPDQLTQLMLTFGALSSGALSPEASLELIEAKVKEFEQRGQ